MLLLFLSMVVPGSGASMTSWFEDFKVWPDVAIDLASRLAYSSDGSGWRLKLSSASTSAVTHLPESCTCGLWYNPSYASGLSTSSPTASFQ